MNLYVSTVNDFINDGPVVNWLTSNVRLVVNDSDHLADFVKKVKTQLLSLRPELMIIIETEYVDAVYRDTYYAYFATKLKPFRRFCVRFSFFENVFSNINDFITLDDEIINKSYLGFLILRPLGKCIGRNAISPKAKNFPFKINSCLAEIQSTCLGFKLKVKAFPHSSQDGEYMTCAETTTWALAEYFGNKYVMYKPLLPSKLFDTLKSHAIERLVPSQGLTIQQISMALIKLGFGCKVYSSSSPRFKELFTCYIESGLPLAVAVGSGTIGHAIVCIGRKNLNRNQIIGKTNILGIDYFVWNISIDEFVFNDDNMPSYQVYGFNNPTPYLNGAKITHFIVPLHKKIYLSAEHAIDISHYFVANDFMSPPESVIRTFLTSSRSYRDYICHNNDIPNKLKLAYLRIVLPKFIWVTEVSSRADFDSRKVNSLILLDATSTLSPGDVYASLILKQNNNQLTLFDKTSRSFQTLNVIMPPRFESFNGNLI